MKIYRERTYGMDYHFANLTSLRVYTHSMSSKFVKANTLQKATVWTAMVSLVTMSNFVG